jgi:AraC family transcriptional regulator, regulatory protein of adaptative response / methylated-DNA-[protein]-cysteine methyltransferase
MNEDILFSTGESVLGVVLVAASERGVCAILLGERAGPLVRDLRTRFPHASLRHAGGELDALVAKVTSFLAAPAAGLDVPLDVQGTEFQLRVWRALTGIPAGTTQTYGTVARRIGAPHAAKEVGEACAANPLAVAIPCHRVVRKDGALSGYRWGAARKRALLEREATA